MLVHKAPVFVNLLSEDIHVNIQMLVKLAGKQVSLEIEAYAQSFYCAALHVTGSFFLYCCLFVLFSFIGRDL